jgi:hypothetical protein
MPSGCSSSVSRHAANSRCHARDEMTEQTDARIGVSALRARLARARECAAPGEGVIGSDVGRELQRQPAGRVGAEVHELCLIERRARERRRVATRRVVQREHGALGGEARERRRQHLRHGADLEQRGSRRGHLLRVVGEARAEHVTTTVDRDSGDEAWDLVLVREARELIGEHGVHAVGVRGRRRAGGERERDPDGEVERRHEARHRSTHRVGAPTPAHAPCSRPSGPGATRRDPHRPTEIPTTSQVLHGGR